MEVKQVQVKFSNLQKTKIYRTDQDGNILFKIKNNKFQIETCIS